MYMQKKRKYISLFLCMISLFLLVISSLPHHHHDEGGICFKKDLAEHPIIMLMIRVAMISASHKYNLFTLQALKRLSRQIIFSSLHSLPCHLLSGCYNHNKGYSKTKHIIT